MSTDCPLGSFRSIAVTDQPNGVDNFSAGVQDFIFSIAGQQRFAPARSYFRMRATLRVREEDDEKKLASPLRKPVVGDGYAFSENFANNLYSNAYFYAGNVSVSSLSQYVSQASMLKYRLSKTKSWLDSIGAGCFYLKPNLDDRISDVSVAGGSIQTKKTLMGYENTAGVAIGNPTSGVATVTFTLGTATEFPELGTWIVGDLFTHPTTQLSHLVVGVISTSQIQINYTGALIAEDDGIWFRTRAAHDPDVPVNGKNQVEIIFVPPLGIFSTSSALCSGTYKISLMPKNDKVAALETKSPVASLSAEGAPVVTVDSLYFFASVFKDTKSYDNGSYYLSLDECNIQTKALATGTGMNAFNFTIPASTIGIAVFAQGTSSGSLPGTTIPPSIFKSLNGDTEALRNIQLTFANTTKPLQDYDSNFTTSTVNATTLQNLTQRYYQTEQNSDLAMGSSEDFTDWLTRGGIYYFAWIRGQNDRSSELQVTATFNSLSAGAQLFVCSIYRKLVKIEVDSGYITQVTTLSI